MILSDKDKKRILKGVEEIIKGGNKKQISNKLGFKSWGQLYQSAYYLFKKDKIKLATWERLRKELLTQGGNQRRKLKNKEREIISKYKNEIYTTRELAKEYNVSKAKIQDILKERKAARSAGKTRLLRPFSGKDITKNIKIPKYPHQIDSDLAEYIGIKIADGWTRKNRFNVGFSFNIEEKPYVYNTVVPLINRIYGITPVVKERPKKTLIEIYINSKKIYYFETKVLGFPRGNKNEMIKVPNGLMARKEFYKDILRGVLDNDFGLVQTKNRRNLVFSTSIKAPLLVPQLKRISNALGFNLRIRERMYLDKRTKKIYKGHRLWFLPSETKKIFHEIGSRNPRNWSKFMLSERYGISPTRTTLQERLKCLYGEISLEDLKEISEERKINQIQNKL